jgi:hypothetical protein
MLLLISKFSPEHYKEYIGTSLESLHACVAQAAFLNGTFLIFENSHELLNND